MSAVNTTDRTAPATPQLKCVANHVTPSHARIKYQKSGSRYVSSVFAPARGNQPRMDWNESVIPVGKGDEGFDVSPDGRELWIANAQDGTLSVVDLTTRTVTATLDAKTFGATRLKFTSDGKLVMI
jgi:YVTN family beta-propeller protein